MPAEPGKTYTYEVQAYGDAGFSERASVVVKTPFPDLGLARLEGDFDANVKLISKHNLFGIPGTFTLGWHFQPRCSVGACNVVWTDLDNGTLKGTLTRRGPVYKGSATGRNGVRCGRTIVMSTLTVSFKVAKGKAILGEWTALRLIGTLSESDAAQLGCAAASASYSFTADLVT